MSIYDCAEAVFGSLAIPGVYTPPSGSAQSCRVILVRAVERFGAMAAEAIIQNDEVAALKAELVLERGGHLTVDGTTFVVAQRLRDDGAIVRWSVRPA